MAAHPTLSLFAAGNLQGSECDMWAQCLVIRSAARARHSGQIGYSRLALEKFQTLKALLFIFNIRS